MQQIFTEPFVKDIAEWAIKFVLQEAVKLSPTILRNAREHLGEIPKGNAWHPSLVTTRTGLIGREKEIRSIHAALYDAPKSHIIYFSGPGGIGKTRLLEEVNTLIHQQKASLNLRSSGILDLYHADLRSVFNLQKSIAEKFSFGGIYFKDYQKAWETYKEKCTSGTVSQASEDNAAMLYGEFLKDFNLFSKKYRPVLTFDTLECLDEEPEPIQALCQINDTYSSVRSWLLNFSLAAQNTVIILAGRPRPQLRAELQQRQDENPGLMEICDLDGLSREDSRRLLELYTKKNTLAWQNLKPETDHLWQLTRGTPVQLALSIELSNQGEQLLLSEHNHSHKEWEQRLINSFFDYNNEEKRLLFFLALARKGLSADLLHYLEPSWTQETCEQQLAESRKFNLTKGREGINDLFLHDALYELFDNCYECEKGVINTWFDDLCSYYHEKKVQNTASHLQRDDATVKLLYYELQQNFRHAFETDFVPWSEAAITGYETELDMQLRNELLTFMNSPVNQTRMKPADQNVIYQDSTVRWIKRYIIREQYKKATSIASTILALGPEEYVKFALSQPSAHLSQEHCKTLQQILASADAFFWGHLLTYYGDALTYTGAPEDKISSILIEAIKILESTNLEHEHPLSWLKTRILGRAYDRLGYLSRNHGHYGKAANYYRHALSHYEQVNIIDEYATTLNNLAFVDSLLGNIHTARLHAERALEQRQILGQRQPLALSYNTRGLINATENPQKARRDCLRALSIFEEIEAPRGRGLACNALGYILRQEGNQIGNTADGSNQTILCFEQSASYLAIATEIFTKKVTEPGRLWEVYNEQGSLFYDWGCILAGNGKSAQEKFMQAVKFHLLALDVAKMNNLYFQESDTCDDLADVYAALENFDEASKWENTSISCLPPNYKLSNNPPDRKHKSNGEVYWLIMEKSNWKQGYWKLSSKGKYSSGVFHEEGLKELTLAYVYARLYWEKDEIPQKRAEQVAQNIKQSGISLESAKHIVEKVGIEYGVNVNALLSLL